MFRVELSCTGKVDSEVMILMQLNLTVNSSKNFTVLNFKRRKMCYKSKEFIYQSMCFICRCDKVKNRFSSLFLQISNQILIIIANEKKSTNRWNPKVITRWRHSQEPHSGPTQSLLSQNLLSEFLGNFILGTWTSTTAAGDLRKSGNSDRGPWVGSKWVSLMSYHYA